MEDVTLVTDAARNREATEQALFERSGGQARPFLFSGMLAKVGLTPPPHDALQTFERRQSCAGETKGERPRPSHCACLNPAGSTWWPR